MLTLNEINHIRLHSPLNRNNINLMRDKQNVINFINEKYEQINRSNGNKNYFWYLKNILKMSAAAGSIILIILLSFNYRKRMTIN
jgi:predicted deacetylase